MRVAVVGSGITGMVVAHLLNQDHDITVFEANNYIGGHTNTIPVDKEDERYDIDTGFIIFNDRTYPNFVRLLNQLKVESLPTEMSFSVRDEDTGFEYNAKTINSLFAQRKNIFNLKFYRMLFDILRFFKNAPALLQEGDHTATLGDYLKKENYCKEFIRYFIFPTASAIWSSSELNIEKFPARYFVQFYHDHGLLSINDHPQWQVVKGGSSRYIGKLTKPYADRIRLKTPIGSIQRHRDHVDVSLLNGDLETFDQVVIATHSDQALKMLADPSEAEQEILTKIPYENNNVFLHTDTSIMPRKRLAWASWNCHVQKEAADTAMVSYYMNSVQDLQSNHDFMVTLNHEKEIEPSQILKRIQYSNPVHQTESVALQKHHHKISGINRTHFCGAYWGYGFHEDGVVSALNVAKLFGKKIDDIGI